MPALAWGLVQGSLHRGHQGWGMGEGRQDSAAKGPRRGAAPLGRKTNVPLVHTSQCGEPVKTLPCLPAEPRPQGPQYLSPYPPSLSSASLLFLKHTKSCPPQGVGTRLSLCQNALPPFLCNVGYSTNLGSLFKDLFSGICFSAQLILNCTPL